MIARSQKYEDTDRFQVYMAHTFRGSSTKSFYHYGQTGRDKSFRMFDYGSASEN